MATSQVINAVTPYLIARGAAQAITFLEAAFGADVVARMESAGGTIGHSELRIGQGTIYLADEHPDLERIVGPASLGGTSVILDLEVEDVVAVHDQAVAAGATSLRRPDPAEEGVQSAKVRDPFGHVWLITRSPAPGRAREPR